MREQGRKEWEADGERRGQEGKEAGRGTDHPRSLSEHSGRPRIPLVGHWTLHPASPDPNLAVCPGKVTYKGGAKKRN